jgi:Mg2+-importing ATPase
LALTSLGVVALAIALPLTPMGHYFGFVAPPWRFYLIVLAMVVLYLVMVQLAKDAFYRWVSRTTALKHSR